VSERENLLSRWSRLKRQSAQARAQEGRAKTKQAAKEAADGAGEAGRDANSATPRDAVAAPIDVASLPPIESIVAGSDIRAFLQKGVPAALTRAALRRAWVSDPAIRDFIEIAENQWDFSRPETIPGFGPLEAAQEGQRLLAQALGEWRAEATSPARETEAASPPEGDTHADACPAGDRTRETLPDARAALASEPLPTRALQHEEDAIATAPPRKPRKHGGALPS
jgi:hypothetical protein